MISYQEALNIIVSHARKLPTQTLVIADALNYICVNNIQGTEAIPPFDNSAMDGFAVRSIDVENASTENPLKLRVAGSTVAGDTPPEKLAAGHDKTAWEIMTGAPVPAAYDSVVMIEQVTIIQRDANQQPLEITLAAPTPKGNNIRLAGEDFIVGDIIVSAGMRITPEHITAMASLGIEKIEVYAKPRVAILSTGKELVEQGELKPGQIRNSNGPYLFSALQTLHTAPIKMGSIPDEPTRFESYINDCSNKADIILSTGAVSAGTHDFIPQSLKKLGANILFHKVAIRPGKPILFAQLPNGTYYFGLPGNPVSAAVGLRFFVTPLLRALHELPLEEYPSAMLANVPKKKNDFRFFQKANVVIDRSGGCRISILPGQESFKIKPLLYSNAWAILPEEQSEFSIGTKIQFAPLHGDQLLLNLTPE